MGDRQKRIFREIGRSLTVAYPKPYWLALSLLLVAILGPVAWFFGFPSEPPARDDSLYVLLSIIPTTLATIIVLAFTFTLVAAQIASNYNHILFHRVLGLWAMWYAGPFALGILLPLFLLNGHFFLWSVQISLLMATFCIVSLLPFAVAVKGLLSISDAILEIKSRLLAAKSDQDAQNLISNLGNITVGALTLRDFDVFDFGVEQLVQAVKDNPSETVQLQVTQEVRRMILRNADDRYASESLMDAMIELGLDTVSNVSPTMKAKILDEVVGAYKSVDISALGDQEETISLIRGLAYSAVDGGQIKIVRKCQTLLYLIADGTISASSAESESAHSAIVGLGDLIQTQLTLYPAKSDHTRSVMSAVMQMEYLGAKAKQSNNVDLWDSARVQLQRSREKAFNDNNPFTRHLVAALARLSDP